MQNTQRLKTLQSGWADHSSSGGSRLLDLQTIHHAMLTISHLSSAKIAPRGFAEMVLPHICNAAWIAACGLPCDVHQGLTALKLCIQKQNMHLSDSVYSASHHSHRKISPVSCGIWGAWQPSQCHLGAWQPSQCHLGAWQPSQCHLGAWQPSQCYLGAWQPSQCHLLLGSGLTTTTLSVVSDKGHTECISAKVCIEHCLRLVPLTLSWRSDVP